MGRWSQSRRRGCGGAPLLTGTAPPSALDWELLDGGGGEIDAKVDTMSPGGPYWGVQMYNDDSSTPGTPNGAEVVDTAVTTLVMGFFGAGRWWARARWIDSDGVTPLSDYSDYQFIDLA